MKKEIIQMYELIDDLGLKHKKFITGSYAFGLKNYRDIDICIYTPIGDAFHLFIDMGMEYNLEYFMEDFKLGEYTIAGIKFHLLIFHKIKEYTKYKKTTRCIKTLIQKDSSFKQKMKNKTFRVHIFEAFKRYYKDK